MHLSVRELQEHDIPLISGYWVNATAEQLLAMGAIKEMVPDEKYWQEALQTQIRSDYDKKQSYCTIWLMDGEPVGHCNVNKIIFGQEAYMHLHLWKADKRKSGMGTALVMLSMPFFFKNLQLKTLYCEPYALNPAPNATLKKLGFDFIKEYMTIPGSLSFEQPTNRWALSLKQFQKM